MHANIFKLVNGNLETGRGAEHNNLPVLLQVQLAPNV